MQGSCNNEGSTAAGYTHSHSALQQTTIAIACLLNASGILCLQLFSSAFCVQLCCAWLRCIDCAVAPVSEVWKLIRKPGIIPRMAATQQGLASVSQARGHRRQGGPQWPAPLGGTIDIGPPQLQPGARHEGVGRAGLQVEGRTSSQLGSLHPLLFSF